MSAPTRLRRRLEGIPFAVDASVEALGDDLVELVGEARLAYGDAGTLRLVPADDVTEMPDIDQRLVAFRETADPFDWHEAAMDEPGAARFGVVEEGALLAAANVQLWVTRSAASGCSLQCRRGEEALARRSDPPLPGSHSSSAVSRNGGHA